MRVCFLILVHSYASRGSEILKTAVLKQHGVPVCCSPRGLATAHARVSVPRRCMTVFSFVGVNGARVVARQPVFHVACRRRAHVRCVTQDAISGFNYRGADGGDDAPGLDWYSS